MRLENGRYFCSCYLMDLVLLDKDLEKLSSITCGAIRYEFFYDRDFNADNYTAYKIKYPEINIIKFETLK